MARHLVLLLAGLLLSSLLQAEPGPERLAQIQDLFPKATRIEDKQTDFPVYPVYQLQELLGYAYESGDFTNLQGFSGRPLSLLVGLDIRGNFTGVHILNHHEPVFLHGLGEEPLYGFVDQYTGRSLTEHVVVNSRKAKSAPDGQGGVVYFDGVTAATVSVLIVNDTILSSALKVAREKLAGFSQAPPVRAKENFYQPLDWPQLRDRGYVGRWSMTLEEARAGLDRPLKSYPGLRDPDPDEPFTEIYYAYLNAPMVGRNLLGDAGYRFVMDRLNPGEQAMAVFSSGLFTHVADDYRPGTTPNQLSLSQGQLATELRDMNLLGDNLRLQSKGMPGYRKAHIFKVGGNAGFNPGAETTLSLNLDLARNPLIVDRVAFTETLALPEELFEAVAVEQAPARQPVWVGMWQDRWVQITVVSLSLVLLTVVFARQRTLSRYPRAMHRFRWGFLFFTLFYLGFYAQGQLSVVNIYTLLLSLWDGFQITMFLLDPVIFILWVYTFVTLFIWGRGLFCGWLCPFGALQEMAAWLGEKLKFRQIRVPERWHRRLILLKYPILLGLVISSFYSLTLAEELAEVEPFKTSITLFFIRSWPFVLYAVALIGIGMFIHKFYCRYLCPLGAGLAVLGRLRLFSWLDRVELCGSPCQVCKNHCGINAIRTDGRIDYDECIQCLECVVILNDEDQCVDRLLQKKQARRARILATDAMPG